VLEYLLISFSVLDAQITGTLQYIADPVGPLLSIHNDPFIMCTSFRVSVMLTAVKVSLNFDRE
jgi:hypothetical protein